ncbi:MAG: alpha-ketoacid dehydrogenase subunit beta [Armatimonadetes bacterium]|nr:alpha-ketoacid dehydrogenase subunit beta [Armatimonadota bacterium]
MSRVIMYREALNEAIAEEMRRDRTVFLAGEGVAERGGSFRTSVGLLDEFGPERVVDTPISEASFTGLGVGAAIVGCRPIIEILFVDFATLIMDQLVNQAAKYDFMSGGRGRVPMVVRTQGGSGNGLAAQHSQSLEAWFYHVPGLKVVMPATPYDAKGLLKSAIRDDDPVVFIEHKLLYMSKGEAPEEEYTVPLGRADVKREGNDVTLISYSRHTLLCLEAARKLSEEGIDVEVVDLRTLSPLDKETILASARKTGRVVVVHEACKQGGVGGDIAAMIMEEAFDYLDAPVVRVAGLDTPIPFNVTLENACTPDIKKICSAARLLLYRNEVM